MYYHEPGDFVVYNADSGVAKFRARYLTRHAPYTSFALTAKDEPERALYLFIFADLYTFEDCTKETEVKVGFTIPQQNNNREYVQFHLTWYNNILQLVANHNIILEYRDSNITSNKVGFLKFKITSGIEWIYDSLPPLISLPPIAIFKGGRLYWEILDDHNGCLPEDALIGGFECEPIYIGRTRHRRSLLPGKYVQSLKKTFITWCGAQHETKHFQILCGYNALWTKTKDNFIPENAFIAGYSSVRREPFYLGRAMINDDLVVGRIDGAQHTCYIPYKGKEVQVHSYEVLVEAKAMPRCPENPVDWEKYRSPTT